MKIFRYWTRGEATTAAGPRMRAFGASNASVDDALAQAEANARRIAEGWDDGEIPTYLYSDRPVREELVETIDGNGDPAAAITRNAYGALILNTSQVMFLDVDDSHDSHDSHGSNAARDSSATARGGGLLARLFGGGWAPDPPSAAEPFEAPAAARPDLGVRVYRTARGHRGLIVNRVFDPMSSESEEVLGHFRCDPLYVKLCHVQECFRARLTAKPWRCAVPRPPSRYPFQTPEHESRYRAWEDEYHAVANRYAACRLVAHHGPEAVHPAVAPIIEQHDQYACADGAELA